MPDAEPADDAPEGADAPVSETAAPERTPAETATAEPVDEAPADDVPADEMPADEASADETPMGETPAPAETGATEISGNVPDAGDSVEKVLSNAAMDSLFEDEADTAADSGDDGNTEDTPVPETDGGDDAGTEDVPAAWTADEDADRGADDDAQADGFPPPPIAAGDTDGTAAAAESGKRRTGLMRLISLLALLLFISAVVGVGYFMQSKVVMWFPATAKIYAMVGLKPDVLGQGLHIADPKPTKEIDGNDEVLVVNGAIKNTSGNKQKVPLLRGALLDKDGKELHIWTFTAQQEAVEPGEQVTYTTQFKNPPAAAEKLDITFTRPNDPQTAGRESAMPDKK